MATQDLYAAARAHTQTQRPQNEVMVAPSDIHTRDDGTQYITVSSEGTSETPTQLLNQGYRQEADGTWAKYLSPADLGENPEQDRLYDEARDTTNRALAADILRQSGILTGAGAFDRSALEQAPLGDEIAAAVIAPFVGQNYSGVRDIQADLAQHDRENFGLQRNAGGLAGFTAGLAVPAGSGVVQAGRGLASQTARATALSSGVGAAYGFGAGEGSFSERLPGAVQGGVIGGVTGGTLHAGGQYAGRLLGISNANAPLPRPSADESAAARLARTIDDTGGAATERSRLEGLGLSPSLMDIGGGTTERLVRTAAGPAGPAANTAVENYVTRAAQLKPEVIASTRRLSPIQETAEQYAETLGTRRDQLASAEYAAPYAAPVELTDDAIRALRGPQGQAAIDRAIATERAFPDYNVDLVNELEALKVADLNARPTVTGRALDSVRRNLRDMSSNAMRGDDPNRALGAAMAQRVEGVDTALDAAPGLLQARGTFRDLSGQIEQLDPRTAINIFEDPADFARRVSDLTPGQREAALVRVRQDITDQLGRQRDAGTGSIDNLRQAQWSQQNLSALIGPERARNYIDELTARVQQTQRAGRVSPNTNSQTFGRMADEQTLGAANAMSGIVDVAQSMRGDLNAGGRTVDRIAGWFARAGMSPEERAAIVNMGVGSADDLERVLMLAEQARQRGQQAPRAVIDFVHRIEANVGGQTAARFESALLGSTSRAAAEEEPR